MAHEFKIQRVVEFADTDMAGILHFANFFRYMEAAEHAFFRSLGLRVHAHSESGVWGWARGRAECTFRGPLRYEDVVELHLLVREKRRKSIDYVVVFRKLVPPDGGAGAGASASADAGAGPGAHAGTGPAAHAPQRIEVARGAMTVVCVGKPAGSDELRAMPMPREVDERIEAAPAGSFEEPERER